jgi:nucleotide-binding universal stress UspA family protein
MTPGEEGTAMARVEWKRILCPVDFSETARAALETAIELASKFDSEIVLVHAYPIPGYTFPDGSAVASSRMLQELADEATRHLEEWRLLAVKGGAKHVTVETAVGDPAGEIVRIAQEAKIDLVVMGTHGRTGIEHALMGSIAERVVRRAKCPVLTVRN